ncbi:Amino acid transporter, transmembrane domain [Phytophthora cactorum]|nr:Amino acid transporter, transmembrane domain [Phytophthora cactorum]
MYGDLGDTTTWSILMALLVLPVCIVPTLKEGAGVAFAGCMGTLVADIMYGMRGHPTAPAPALNFSQVVGAFGNLALAYGAGIVIPALQHVRRGCHAKRRRRAGKSRLPKRSFISVVDNENVNLGHPEAEAAEDRGANAIEYVTLRVVIVAILLIASVILKGHFADLSNFVGASCITMHSIILPIVFLMKKQWSVMPVWEKVTAVIVTANYTAAHEY